MNDEIVFEALESTAGNRKARGRLGDPATGDHADIRLWRDSLLRFLNELGEDLTVGEVVESLDNWS